MFKFELSVWCCARQAPCVVSAAAWGLWLPRLCAEHSSFQWRWPCCSSLESSWSCFGRRGLRETDGWAFFCYPHSVLVSSPAVSLPLSKSLSLHRGRLCALLRYHENHCICPFAVPLYQPSYFPVLLKGLAWPSTMQCRAWLRTWDFMV